MSDFKGDFLEDEGFDETDPQCSDCGCDLFTEDHDWDCAFYGDDDEDDCDEEDDDDDF